MKIYAKKDWFVQAAEYVESDFQKDPTLPPFSCTRLRRAIWNNNYGVSNTTPIINAYRKLNGFSPSSSDDQDDFLFAIEEFGESNQQRAELRVLLLLFAAEIIPQQHISINVAQATNQVSS
jgi:hypothetical protein